MSATAAKRLRRDMRRAVGDEAVGIIDALVSDNKLLRATLAQHAELLKVNIDARALLAQRIEALEKVHAPA